MMDSTVRHYGVIRCVDVVALDTLRRMLGMPASNMRLEDGYAVLIYANTAAHPEFLIQDMREGVVKEGEQRPMVTMSSVLKPHAWRWDFVKSQDMPQVDGTRSSSWAALFNELVDGIGTECVMMPVTRTQGGKTT